MHELISKHQDIINAILKKAQISTVFDFLKKDEFIALMCEELGKNKYDVNYI